MSTFARRAVRRRDAWVKALVAAMLLMAWLLDAYALYQIHVQRLGNALDYYPFWAGGREVALHHRNPYDPVVMRTIQEAIYGRPALPGENQHGYAYPAYAPFVVLPFLLLPFPASAALWIASQQFLVVAAVILTVRATGWQIGRWHLVILCLVAMTFRYSMISLVLGQTSVWVLWCLALALWAAQRRRGILAGVALAAGSIKPQLIVLPTLAMLACLPARQRHRVLLGLGGALAALLAASWLFAGPWLADYLQQLRAYRGYSSTEFPVLALVEGWLPGLLSELLNLATTGGLLGLLVAVVWHRRGSGQVAFPLALAIVITQLVVPQTGTYNLVLLLLPAVVTLQRLNTEPLRRRRSSVVGQAVVWADLVLIPWLLWPVVRDREGAAWDQILVPALLLVVMLSVASHGTQEASDE